jgi:hypothetical protein
MIVKQGLFGRGPVGRDRERGEGDGGGIIWSKYIISRKIKQWNPLKIVKKISKG